MSGLALATGLVFARLRPELLPRAFRAGTASTGSEAGTGTAAASKVVWVADAVGKGDKGTAVVASRPAALGSDEYIPAAPASGGKVVPDDVEVVLCSRRWAGRVGTNMAGSAPAGTAVAMGIMGMGIGRVAVLDIVVAVFAGDCVGAEEGAGADARAGAGISCRRLSASLTASCIRSFAYRIK